MKTIIIAGAVVFVVRSVLFQPFLVSGASMEPNIQQNNYLIIDEATYFFFREPRRGEVVVFRYPENSSTFYIKRIIGLPGETVVVENGKIKINGVELVEDEYLSGVQTFGAAQVTLEKDAYFVMGDNRANSYDSRSWGPLDRRMIIGKALIRLYPFNNMMIFTKK